MNDEAAFLEAIRSAPNDAVVRLAYAAWLEERGDRRAEFVRLHVQLAEVLDRLQHARAGLDTEWMDAVEFHRDVVVHSFTPDNFRSAIKILRMNTCNGLMEAKAKLSQLPSAVIQDLPLERAERVRQDFAAIATAFIEPTVEPHRVQSETGTSDQPR